MFVGFCFGKYQGSSGYVDLEPPKSLIFVVWSTELGLSHLYWADYESIYVQNMGPTTHIHSYMQTYTYCKING